MGGKEELNRDNLIGSVQSLGRAFNKETRDLKGKVKSLISRKTKITQRQLNLELDQIFKGFKTEYNLILKTEYGVLLKLYFESLSYEEKRKFSTSELLEIRRASGKFQFNERQSIYIKRILKKIPLIDKESFLNRCADIVEMGSQRKLTSYLERLYNKIRSVDIEFFFTD